MPRRLAHPLFLVLSLLLVPLSARANAASEATCAGSGPPVIPSVPLEQDRFALALNRLCSDLRTSRFEPGEVTDLPAANLAPARAAERFEVESLVAAVSSNGNDKTRAAEAVASLSALDKTCEAIALRRLDAQDLQNLREFHGHLPEVLFVMDQLALNQKTLKALFTGTSGIKSGGEETAAGAWRALEGNLVTGLTTFVVERAKAEAALYLSRHLEQTLCQGPARPYHGHLCVALGELDVKLRLSAMGAYLQAAARRDLESLPDTLLEQTACQQPARVSQLTAARLGLAFYREAEASRHPLELARNLQHVRLACAPGACSELMAAIQVGSRLTEAIQRQSGWERLPLSAPDDIRWRHYALGTLLSFEKLQNLTLSEAELATGLNTIDGALHEVVAISSAIQQLGEDDKDSRALALGVQVSRSVAVFIQLGIEGGQRWAGLNATQTQPLLVAREVARFGERSLDDLRPGSLALALSDLLVGLRTHVPELQLPPVVSKVMPFMVELANATTSDQVASAIQTAAAPVGGYESKFERLTVSLNALLGASGGFEWLDDGTSATNSPVLGLIAPVGVHVAGPVSKNVHLGVMASVLDLGNLAAVRLDNETRTGNSSTSVDNPSQVGFSQVFGPGFYATLGLGLGTKPRSPFILGAGVSLVPGGRQVRTTTTAEDGAASVTTTTHTAVRASLFLAVDVTLLSF
jgi:hypothetical protein